MGNYLNPGNSGFEEIIKSEYVDKTGLISLINKTIGTTDKLTCISRPRRFGKSFAAKMLCAYYDCTCDSNSLFKNLEIYSDDSFDQHLNKYNVIYLDITGFISYFNQNRMDLSGIVSYIIESIKKELLDSFPSLESVEELTSCLIKYSENTGKKFIFIIDEWDAIIREAKDDENAQITYLNLLRSWFKNGNFTPKAVAAAYMTGILPIKKDGTESAISDFQEYTILNPGNYAKYTGFTENEVVELCNKHGNNFSSMKEWYDGYSFSKAESIYNPYSVMTALKMDSFESYWQKTSAAESLSTYINLNYDGLQDDVLRLITGEHLEVSVDSFENDVESFKSKDDVITLMIHLGYLAYDNKEKTVRIPNKEVETEFNNLLKNSENTKLYELIQKSDELLKSTLSGDENAVASGIQAIRESSYAPTFYNDEQALRYVIKFAYVVCIDQYLKVEEMPSGRGIADVVFIPKQKSPLPAMIVELKWNKTEEAAIGQIKKKNYPSALKDYSGEIVLVGINYDEKSKIHTCKIERV